MDMGILMAIVVGGGTLASIMAVPELSSGVARMINSTKKNEEPIVSEYKLQDSTPSNYVSMEGRDYELYKNPSETGRIIKGRREIKLYLRDVRTKVEINPTIFEDQIRCPDKLKGLLRMQSRWEIRDDDEIEELNKVNEVLKTKIRNIETERNELKTGYMDKFKDDLGKLGEMKRVIGGSGGFGGIMPDYMRDSYGGGYGSSLGVGLPYSSASRYDRSKMGSSGMENEGAL